MSISVYTTHTGQRSGPCPVLYQKPNYLGFGAVKRWNMSEGIWWMESIMKTKCIVWGASSSLNSKNIYLPSPPLQLLVLLFHPVQSHLIFWF